MSNVAPEHGPTPFGAVGDGGPISATARGTRPPMPHDPLGPVSDTGPSSAQPFNDPNDPDRDMDTEGPADFD